MTQIRLVSIELAPGAWPFVGIGLVIATAGLAVILYGRRRSNGRKWTPITVLGLAIGFTGMFVMSLRRD